MEGFIPKVGTGRNVVGIKPTTWNKIADAINGGRLSQQPAIDGTLASWRINVINKTGSAITAPYRAFSLGDPDWTVGTNKLADCCWRLATFDETKPIVVVQTPLAVDEVGAAVAVGPTLAEVSSGGSTTDRQGNPNSSGIVVPGSGTKIQFVGPRPTSGGLVLALLGAGSAAAIRYARPPSGGIPAATWNGTVLTPGAATCQEMLYVANVGNYQVTGVSFSVQNIVQFAVGANQEPIAVAPTQYGTWVAVVENCGAE